MPRGTKASLAIAMTGLTTEALWHGRTREASRLATEQMALLESVGDPALTVAGAYVPMVIKSCTGEFAEALRWSQTVIDLAEGDPTKGANFAVGSPLAAALTFRGAARYWLGRAGWRREFDDAVAMARRSDPVTHALIVASVYGLAVSTGVLRADDGVVRELEETLQTAERSGDDTALGPVKCFLGGILMDQDAPADRDRGLELVTQARDTWLREGIRLYLVPTATIAIAREKARRGDGDGAIPVLRAAVEELFQSGQVVPFVLALAVLAETLLDRAGTDDVAEAEAAIDRFANLPTTEDWAVRDVWLLRLRALRSRARGDDVAYRGFVNRYRAMAQSLGFEGHMAMAEAMQ